MGQFVHSDIHSTVLRNVNPRFSLSGCFPWEVTLRVEPVCYLVDWSFHWGRVNLKV